MVICAFLVLILPALKMMLTTLWIMGMRFIRKLLVKRVLISENAKKFVEWFKHAFIKSSLIYFNTFKV